MNEKQTRRILQKGNEYVEIELEKQYKNWDVNKNVLTTSVEDGFKFIVAHLFYRGRGDELSIQYYRVFYKYLKLCDSLNEEKIGKTLEILGNISPETTSSKKSSEIKGSNQLMQNIELPEGLKNHKINFKDIQMLISVFGLQQKFFKEHPENPNLYNYFVELIKDHKMDRAYYELVQLEQVGDKLESFTLRDIVFSSPALQLLEFTNLEYTLLFPVDTWVKKAVVDIRFGVEELKKDIKKFSDYGIKLFAITLCHNEKLIGQKEYPLFPLKVNAGMWLQGIQGSKKK